MDSIDTDRFPEWGPFAEAVQQRSPETGTWCEAWTVRDIVVHQTGNAEELARVLEGHLAGEPVQTRDGSAAPPAHSNWAGSARCSVATELQS